MNITGTVDAYGTSVAELLIAPQRAFNAERLRRMEAGEPILDPSEVQRILERHDLI